MRRLLSLLLASLLALVLAPDAFAQKGKKRPPPKPRPKPKTDDLTAPARSPSRAGTMIGLGAGLSYESIEVAGSDPKIALDGFGFTGLGTFDAMITDSLGAPISLGIHYVSVAGQSETVKITISMVSIVVDVGILYRFSPAFRAGVFGAYDFGISGEADFEVRGVGTSSSPLASSSRTPLGGRFLYYANPGLAAGIDVATVSGSIEVKPEESAGDDPEADDPSEITGLNFRFLLTYYL